MAVKDGELFVKEQIESILPQLTGTDEIIVSNDGSRDRTLDIIRKFDDPRVTILQNPGAGILDNFQNALSHARGDKLFLCDQDDLWAENKIKRMSSLLDRYDAVVCDCTLVDEEMNPMARSFFELNNSNKGLIKNIMRNSYVGCCMAFNRRVLSRILPFPKDIPMHDQWIGLVAELHYSVLFHPEKLVFYRRHRNSASTTSAASSRSIAQKMSSRYHLIKNLLKTTYA